MKSIRWLQGVALCAAFLAGCPTPSNPDVQTVGMDAQVGDVQGDVQNTGNDVRGDVQNAGNDVQGDVPPGTDVVGGDVIRVDTTGMDIVAVDTAGMDIVSTGMDVQSPLDGSSCAPGTVETSPAACSDSCDNDGDNFSRLRRPPPRLLWSGDLRGRYLLRRP